MSGGQKEILTNSSYEVSEEMKKLVQKYVSEVKEKHFTNVFSLVELQNFQPRVEAIAFCKNYRINMNDLNFNFESFCNQNNDLDLEIEYKKAQYCDIEREYFDYVNAHTNLDLDKLVITNLLSFSSLNIIVVSFPDIKLKCSL